MMERVTPQIADEAVSRGADVSATARKPAPLSAEERRRFEGYAAEIFARLGMDLDSAGARETPRRWLQGLLDMTRGYHGDPKIGTVFPKECDGCGPEEYEQTVEGPIRFVALCEHHVLPFIGSAWVGYLRNEKIIGLSKLTRIVRQYSKRFTLQERIAQEVLGEVMRLTAPYGAAIYLESHHTCTRARGVENHTAFTRTFVARGRYDIHTHLRDEFMVIAGLKRPPTPY